MKIFLLLLMIAQYSFAQTLGNPGGGGPDDEMRNQSTQCRIHLSTLKELENDLARAPGFLYPTLHPFI